MRYRTLFAICLMLVVSSAVRAAQVDLAGPWGLLLDRQNRGEANQWQTPAFWNSGKEPATVRLPGSIQSQHIGDLPTADSPWTARIGMNLLKSPKYAPFQQAGGFKTPFWLTPDRVYVGSAWYQREVEIPASFIGQRITLVLERPHWETTVWVDGKQVGVPQNSLATPHVYDLTEVLGEQAAGTHTLVIRVDNRIKVPVGLDASSVTDQTQTNWNGIVGDVKLVSTPKTWIEDVQAYPEVATGKVRLRVNVRTLNGAPGPGNEISMAGRLRNAPNARMAALVGGTVQWKRQENTFVGEATFDLGPEPQLWSEFSPALYDVTVTIQSDEKKDLDSRAVTFGLREIGTKGTQFVLNGKPLFLRGTLECAIFPLTGYPPAGDSGRVHWEKIFTQAKAFGLNHLRFHSWCPPEIAFQVADEMGFYLQVEGGVWAAFGSSGRPPAETQAEDAGGQGGAALDTWIVKEADAILREFGNHPSFVLMAAANEPGSRSNQPNANFLNTLVQQWKEKDPRHLYTAGSNWPNVPNANFQVMSSPRLNAGNAMNRITGTQTNYAQIVSQWQVPVISHETGQWCAYPNMEEIAKYTGALHPGNLEIFKAFLENAGMWEQAHDFLMASGHFQVLLYKEEIETLLRTPEMGGFQLLDLHDFPGQGTAPVGVLDAFWDAKPYVHAAEYSRFCGPTVPLAVMPKRVYVKLEKLNAQIWVSHFGTGSLNNHSGVFSTHGTWRLVDDNGKEFENGTLNLPDIAPGNLVKIHEISLPLAGLAAPARYRLEVTLRHTVAMGMKDGKEVPSDELFTNDWDIWLYPPASEVDIQVPDGMRIANTLDQETEDFLNDGGKLLLLPGVDHVAGDTRSSFSPIFWNRITFQNPAKEHTLSILCDPKHLALTQFPTDAYTNWQWSDLLQQNRAKPMVLDGLPRGIKPIVQFIDDWDTARRLGLIIEAKVGEKGGKILICSIDLQSGLQGGGNADERPVARQLLSSLLSYMNGIHFLTEPEPKFNADGELIPAPLLPELTIEQLHRLLK